VAGKLHIEIIKDWINKADEDFEFAAVNFKEGKPLLITNENPSGSLIVVRTKNKRLSRFYPTGVSFWISSDNQPIRFLFLSQELPSCCKTHSH